MARLLALREWLQRQRCFRFYRTALLLLWSPVSREASRGAGRETPQEGDADCRWIDFAYAFPLAWQGREGRDSCCSSCCTCGAAAAVKAQMQQHPSPGPIPPPHAAAAARPPEGWSKGRASCCVVRANKGLLEGIESLLVLLRSVLWGSIPSSDPSHCHQRFPEGTAAVSLASPP